MLSFFAGTLFFLAGALNLFVGIHAHRSTSSGLGAMFVCVGSLWIAIGARSRRAARMLDSHTGLQQGER